MVTKWSRNYFGIMVETQHQESILNFQAAETRFWEIPKKWKSTLSQMSWSTWDILSGKSCGAKGLVT